MPFTIDPYRRPKKPHFVPVAYLQSWGSSGRPQGRHSKILWCDGKVSKLQRAGTVTVQVGFYSAKNSNVAEAYFGEFEANWEKLVRRLIAGRPRSEILASQLLLQSSYFLLRNPKFSINDSAERFEMYKLAVEEFWQKILMAGHVPEQMNDAPKQLLKTWSCYLLRAQSESWITSDNPVLLLTIGETTPVLIFFLADYAGLGGLSAQIQCGHTIRR